MHLVYPQNFAHCFQYLLGITVVQREIQDNDYAEFWGVEKLHYGLCEISIITLMIIKNRVLWLARSFALSSYNHRMVL